ncbi:hypothetical protein CR51_07405 [Caballeronia megalochromosomata]|nr:hypothetical protein CR51_07405 [Caballeronia megalochromosomata]
MRLLCETFHCEDKFRFRIVMERSDLTVSVSFKRFVCIFMLLNPSKTIRFRRILDAWLKDCAWAAQRISSSFGTRADAHHASRDGIPSVVEAKMVSPVLALLLLV